MVVASTVNKRPVTAVYSARTESVVFLPRVSLSMACPRIERGTIYRSVARCRKSNASYEPRVLRSSLN